jgi:four helix bundle protein
VQNFQKLEVWQKAINFANSCYQVTQSFPKEEMFGLTSQIRRASVSISSNIAEGSSRSSRIDFSRFIEIATGSTFETLSLFHVAKDQKFLSEKQYQELSGQGIEIIRMLSGLRKSLKKND